MSMKRFMNKKVVAVGLAAGIALGGAGAAFAYFTSTGSGTGTGTGQQPGWTVVQDSIVYNGPSSDAGTDLLPGDTATVAFGITNPGGEQHGERRHAGELDRPMTRPTVVRVLAGESGLVHHGQRDCQPAVPERGRPVDSNTGTIKFNNVNSAQNACAGKT